MKQFIRNRLEIVVLRLKDRSRLLRPEMEQDSSLLENVRAKSRLLKEGDPSLRRIDDHTYLELEKHLQYIGNFLADHSDQTVVFDQLMLLGIEAGEYCPLAVSGTITLMRDAIDLSNPTEADVQQVADFQLSVLAHLNNQRNAVVENIMLDSSLAKVEDELNRGSPPSSVPERAFLDSIKILNKITNRGADRHFHLSHKKAYKGFLSGLSDFKDVAFTPVLFFFSVLSIQ